MTRQRPEWPLGTEMFPDILPWAMQRTSYTGAEAITFLAEVHGISEQDRLLVHQHDLPIWSNHVAFTLKRMTELRLHRKRGGFYEPDRAAIEAYLAAEPKRALPRESSTASPETSGRSAKASRYEGYWIFCNMPALWDIQAFLETGREIDSWGVDRRGQYRHFAPGQLALIRVGTDRRTKAQLKGRPRLQPGFYAVCEVLSAAVPGRGAAREFWQQGEGREPDWPTVKIRYLRSFVHAPLTLDALRQSDPDLPPHIFDGFRGASLPVSKQVFDRIAARCSFHPADLERVGADLSANDPVRDWEARYGDAPPDVQEVISRRIERGPVGAKAKEANGHKCQLCAALGRDPIAFHKRDGTPYVEAHHVFPLSSRAAGSASILNIVVVCPNHHRELHYGEVTVRDEGVRFRFEIAGHPIEVEKCALQAKPKESRSRDE